jgi:ribosomal-protein-alanine N-acetyltransferase
MTSLFKTERLLLRLPAPSDAAELTNFHTVNRAHLQPWSPTFSSESLVESFWQRRCQEWKAEFEAGQGAHAFLFRHDEPHRVVGSLSLTQISRGVFQASNLGYALAADAQGQGLMLEAVRGAVAYAFGPLHLHRVMASYMPHNGRSANVLRRAGFTIEGFARDYLLINGRWEDHILTAITNPEWRDPSLHTS